MSLDNHGAYTIHKKRFEVERKVKERSREDKLDSSGGDSGEDGSEKGW